MRTCQHHHLQQQLVYNLLRPRIVISMKQQIYNYYKMLATYNHYMLEKFKKIKQVWKYILKKG